MRWFGLSILLVMLLLAPNPLSGTEYTLHSDGYYYSSGVPYSRTWVGGYYYWHGGYRYYQDGYYQYTPVKIVEKTTEKLVPLDWRTKLLELRKEQIEQQNYVDSIKFLGLENPYKYPLPLGVYGHSVSVIGTYGVQGSTFYGVQPSLNSLTDLYGTADPNVNWQQLARILEGTQSLLGQGTKDFGDLLGRDTDNRARIAEIVAKGQALDRVLRDSPKTETKQFNFKIGQDGKIEKNTLELLPSPKGDIYQRWSAQAQGCANCHFGDKKSGGFDIASWPGLPKAKKLEYAANRLLTNDPDKLMTPTKTASNPGQPIPEADVLSLWLKVEPR